MNGKNKRGVDHITAYVLGRIEQYIEDYTRGTEVSSTDLAQRVGECLLANANGAAHNGVQAVRGVRAGLDQAVGQKEMDRDSHAGEASVPALKTVSYRRRRRYGRGYERVTYQIATRRGPGAYRGAHWMQKPENRQKMLKAVRHMIAATKKRYPTKK